MPTWRRRARHLESPRDSRRVLVVAHDAHPHGGQYLALNMARELKDIGIPVSVALLGPGRLADDFRRLCPVYEAFDDAAVAALVQRCRDDGTSLVLANTAVSGRVVPAFRRAGIEVLSLVHELPGVIREMASRRRFRPWSRIRSGSWSAATPWRRASRPSPMPTHCAPSS